MKKTLTVFLVLVLLATGGFLTATVAMMNAAELVILEKCTYGDSAYAENLTAEVLFADGTDLEWRARVTLGSKPQCEAVFSFLTFPLHRAGEYYRSARDEIAGEAIDYSWMDENGLTAYMDENAVTPLPGEYVERTLDLRDFMTSYPVSVYLNLPELLGITMTEENYQQRDELMDALDAHIRFPLVEEVLVYAQYTHRDSYLSFADGNRPEVHADAYAANNTLYICVSCVMGEHTQGALYTVSYTQDGDDVVFDTASIRTVLLQEGPVWLSKDRTKLQSIVREDEQWYLLVTDLVTMEETTRLPLTNSSFLTSVPQFHEGFIVLQKPDGRAAILGETFNGATAQLFVPSYTAEYSYKLHFDGDRLLVLDNHQAMDYEEEQAFQNHIFGLEVYTSDGLQYQGKYYCNYQKEKTATMQYPHCYNLWLTDITTDG